MTTNTPARRARLGVLDGWLERSRSWRALQAMDERSLNDMGLTKADVTRPRALTLRSGPAAWPL